LAKEIRYDINASLTFEKSEVRLERNGKELELEILVKEAIPEVEAFRIDDNIVGVTYVDGYYRFYQCKAAVTFKNGSHFFTTIQPEYVAPLSVIVRGENRINQLVRSIKTFMETTPTVEEKVTLVLKP